MSSLVNNTIMEYQRSASRTILFSVILIFVIPSYFCYSFIFYNCIRISSLRKNPKNRVILVLLVVFFIQALYDIPSRLYYLYNGTVPIHTESFCLTWFLLRMISNVIGLHLMALVSIERYFLIFHHVFVTRYRFYISTIPMIIIIIYPIVWYITVTFTASKICNYKPNYFSMECGSHCFFGASLFYLYFVVYEHHLLPIFITTFMNLFLIISVMNHKAKMKRINSWRKNWKMTSQLLSVALFYLVIWLPHCIFGTSPLFPKSDTKIRLLFLYSEYFENFLSIFVCLFPFITLIGLSQMHNKMKKNIENLQQFYFQYSQRRVRATISTTNPQSN